MEYNWKAICARIKEERKKLSLSQEKLAGEIYVTRHLLIRWEKGESFPSLENLIMLCKIFRCELGYLLCEYNDKTRQITDVQLATGLSDTAIRKLYTLRTYTSGHHSPLNSMLTHKSFMEFLLAVQRYVYSFNQNHYSINNSDSEAAKALTDTFNCEPSDLKEHMRMSSVAVIQSALMNIVKDIGVPEAQGNFSMPEGYAILPDYDYESALKEFYIKKEQPDHKV